MDLYTLVYGKKKKKGRREKKRERKMQGRVRWN